MSTNENNIAPKRLEADYADPMLTTPPEDVVSLKVYAIPSSPKEGFKQVAQISLDHHNRPSVFSAELLDFIPDLSNEDRADLEKRIAFIMKITGLDGPYMTKTAINGHKQDVTPRRNDLERRLLAQANIFGDGAADRIRTMADQCEDIESLFQKLLKRDPLRSTFKHMRTFAARYENSNKEKQKRLRKNALDVDGMDLSQGSAIAQFTRSQRIYACLKGLEDAKQRLLHTLDDLDLEERTAHTPAQKLADITQQKNLERLEKNRAKRKKQQSAPTESAQNFLSAGDFDRAPGDVELSAQEKIKIIMKAAGLDGPHVGQDIDFSEIPHNSIARELFQRQEKIRQEISAYLDVKNPGAADRINHLFDLADKTESTLDQLSELPARRRNRELLLTGKIKFDEMEKHPHFSDSKRQKSRMEIFAECGIDVDQDIAQQDIMRQRLEIWDFGVHALTNNFDFVVSKIRAQIKSAEETYFSPAERRLLAEKEKNLARLGKKNKKQAKNSAQQASREQTPHPPSSQNDTAAAYRGKLETLLNTVLAATEDLQKKLESERAALPGNQTYLEEQLLLLEIVTDDFATLRDAVVSLQSRKQELLEQIETAGRSVSARELPADIEAILNKAAEGIPAAHDGHQPESGPTAPLAAYSDLDEFRDDFPDLCEQIAAARTAQDELSNASLATQNENLRIGAATRQTESSMARTIALTEKLNNFRTELAIEVDQLAYRLENPEADAPLSAIFQVQAKYPPLSHIEAWAKDNLDKSRIIVLPSAFKRAAASPYSNPDLVFGALKFLEKECWDMHFSGKSDPEVKQSYANKLAELGLTDASSKIGKIDPKIRDKYTAWVDGKKYELDHHFKRTTSRTKQHCFRLYYAYDNPNERIIVGHMPDHLPTMIS